MTLSDTTRSKRATGNGITTQFSFPFPVSSENDIKVYKIDTSTTPETLGSPLTINVDYTVSLNAVSEGGTITYTVAPTSNQDSFIIRDVSYTQGTDFVTNESFDEEAVEDALDKLTMLAIQLQDDSNRTLKANEYYVGSADFTIPNPESSKVIGWDSTGLQMTNFSGSDLDTILTSSYGQQLVQSANAETARSFLGLSIASQAEVHTGTATDKVITPATYSGSKIYGSYQLSATQPVTTGVTTKVQLNLATISDSNLTFDGVTNYRITPQIAGTYKITARGVPESADAVTAFGAIFMIYVNGVEISRGQHPYYLNGSGIVIDEVPVSMNGSSDYVELFVQLGGSGNTDVLAGTRLMIERVK